MSPRQTEVLAGAGLGGWEGSVLDAPDTPDGDTGAQRGAAVLQNSPNPPPEGKPNAKQSSQGPLAISAWPRTHWRSEAADGTRGSQPPSLASTRWPSRGSTEGAWLSAAGWHPRASAPASPQACLYICPSVLSKVTREQRGPESSPSPQSLYPSASGSQALACFLLFCQVSGFWAQLLSRGSE